MAGQVVRRRGGAEGEATPPRIVDGAGPLGHVLAGMRQFLLGRRDVDAVAARSINADGVEQRAYGYQRRATVGHTRCVRARYTVRGRHGRRDIAGRCCPAAAA